MREASGGEGNANIKARGLPSNGGGTYTQMFEDGLDITRYLDI